MERVCKTIMVSDGLLFAIVGTNRYQIAECEANIEIRERITNVPILGKGRVIDSRKTVLLITFTHRPKVPVHLSDIERIEFAGEMLRSDGAYEKIVFGNCQLLDELDLTAESKCTFEAMCSETTLKKLMIL